MSKGGKNRDWGYASYDVDKYDDYSDSNLGYTSYENNGKIIRPFTTHEGSGLSGVPRQLSEICAPAEITSGLAIVGSQVNNSKAKVEEWIWSHQLNYVYKKNYKI